MRSLLLITGAALVLSMAGAARAQEAAASGPLTHMAYGPRNPADATAGSLAYMVSGLPAERPLNSVEIWFWVFFDRDVGAQGALNTFARRERIDCGARQMQTIATEYYKGGTFLRRVAMQRAPIVPSAGSVEATVIDVACDRSSRGGRPVHPTLLAARAAADLGFQRIRPGQF